MSRYEYWIGKGVDYERVWRDYESGLEYVDKFISIRSHLIRIELTEFPKHLPLFNHEVVYKTIKGYFHDLKQICFSADEYVYAAPLFLYSVGRGSGVWEFLVELRQLLLFGTTLADEKTVGQKLDNIDKRLEILRKHFGDAVRPRDFQKFMQARTSAQIDLAIQKLIRQGIRRVQISKEPFDGSIEAIEASLVDLRRLPEADGEP
jgi:hypothetical protein